MRNAVIVTLAALGAASAVLIALPPVSLVRGGASAAAQASAPPLVLGSLAPETGPGAPHLAALRTPVEQAVRDIDAAGGVGRGRAVKLVTADEGGDDRTAMDATRDLVERQHARLVIGPASSTAALAILDQVKGSALVCSGTNTAAALSSEGPARSGGLYFRTAPSDRLQGAALAELVLSDGHSRVGVLQPVDPENRAIATAAARALREGGATVTVAPFDAGREAPESAVDRVLGARPNAILVVADAAQGARIEKTLVDRGLPPTELPTYGTSALLEPGFPAQVDPANPGVVNELRGTTPAADPGGPDTAFDRSFASTGIDPYFSSYAYDCTVLAALAAVKARSIDPARMAHAFAANVQGATDCRTYADCKRLLQRGLTIHYRGASSAFERWDTSEPDEGTYDTWEYDATATGRLDGPESQIVIR
jgi:branched-chain amino acid transport system substrate-binding protein